MRTIEVSVLGSYYPYFNEERFVAYDESNHYENVKLPKKVDVFPYYLENEKEEPLYEVHEGGDIYLRNMTRQDLVEEYCPRQYRNKVEQVFVAQMFYHDENNDMKLAAKVIFVTEN